MRILTQLPQHDLAQVAAAAKAAEAAGYDGVTTSENKNDPFLAHALAGVATTRVSLETSIAISFSRSPMAVANVSWDLQSASRGRFVLGLGSQVRAHNENRFSVPWTAPAPRMREYVLALRAIWRNWEKGEKLDFRGAHYTFTLMTPNFTPVSTHQPPIAVTIAAVGPAMLRVAGETCDGVRLHGFCTRKYIDEIVMKELRTGMAKANRTRDRFAISGGGFIATGPDEAAVAKMVEWVRYRVAFYGSTPAYWPVLEVHGLHELGRKLNVMSKAGQWDRMSAEISDDVVRLFAAVGTHKELARAIEARFGGVCDAVAPSGGYGVHQDLPADLIQDLKRIPSPFTGHPTTWD
ncbi:MAG: TIGR03617 family F420-dependent LLM class oxidoreductase [Candidatus Rokubacteria bacterium]|nr:TIGR03617 family F420-dependent LLM class oxidoreductase [Candidatus Rokubacteria bacterium]